MSEKGRVSQGPRLNHPELLEAAHIIPDRDPRGLPTVTNGLALCALHHKAFDHHILGIRPDYRIELRQDILDEVDGPMLARAGFPGQGAPAARRPLERPSQEHLEARYVLFRKAG